MTVRVPRYSKEEFARRGDEIYNRDIRPLVENIQNKGKFVAIDIETGLWEMDGDEIIAGDQLVSRVPDAQTWMVRVGYGYLRCFGAGETLENKQGGNPIAEISPVAPIEPNLRPFGLCAGEFSVPSDFDAPLPDTILSEFVGGRGSQQE